jgi:RecJ-like exonuclease
MRGRKKGFGSAAPLLAWLREGASPEDVACGAALPVLNSSVIISKHHHGEDEE